MIQGKLVVIGHGMVGHQFVLDAIELGLHKCYEIHVFGEESYPAYDRVQLSSYFESKDFSQLQLMDESVYSNAGIKLHLAEQVVHLDRENKVITTHKTTYGYEFAILATGSFPFVPPIQGNDLPGCFVYRTIDDLDQIIDSAAVDEGAPPKRGVVIGGGLLGLEGAKALQSLGLETHVVEFAPRLMGVQLDDQGAKLLRQKIEEMGVHVHTSKATQVIQDGNERGLQLQFADGETLETDIIVFSAGIRPQDQVARDAGLEVGDRGGICVDHECRTSDEFVYAIGECALWEGRIFGLVAPGYQMAKVAASIIAQEKSRVFSGADMSTKLKLLGVDVGSIGDAHGTTPGAMPYIYFNPRDSIYKKLVVSSNGKKLLGAILVGDTTDYGNFLQLFLNEVDLPESPESLILPNVEAPVMGVDVLPDTAQICSCFNVTKGELCSAVSEGATSVGELKACTKASSGCGGCSALVKSVLDSELVKLGVEVNTHLCEHFPYSREELYHLVRVGEIKTFQSLLNTHGSGKGCEICKPTAASIFASCWNDYILRKGHASLQDSNDYYLGNIQKDGTYSVVPRVPAGEITPEKLIVLGQVAKEFDLYTKITGGQRVDLFGARVDQLPDIWGQLVAAGFETGHAYGKSLRTVKSCVGSTWCRYGVANSIDMAVAIESRYKGLRSPHKIKMAVSGCTRECAEAQSKDVGIIATENGWNLFIGGNGGMRPRHGTLFASDLTDEQLITYIDRFVMFYIKTADRLQRTSVWFESLEGGLSYLQDVIIRDSLGIAQELEDQMALVVDTYQCEWKTTIEDPEKLKRFRRFVNADEPESTLVYNIVRGQKIPLMQIKEEVDAL